MSTQALFWSEEGMKCVYVYTAQAPGFFAWPPSSAWVPSEHCCCGFVSHKCCLYSILNARWTGNQLSSLLAFNTHADVQLSPANAPAYSCPDQGWGASAGSFSFFRGTAAFSAAASLRHSAAVPVCCALSISTPTCTDPPASDMYFAGKLQLTRESGYCLRCNEGQAHLGNTSRRNVVGFLDQVGALRGGRVSGCVHQRTRVGGIGLSKVQALASQGLLQQNAMHDTNTWAQAFSLSGEAHAQKD